MWSKRKSSKNHSKTIPNKILLLLRNKNRTISSNNSINKMNFKHDTIIIVFFN